MYQPSWIYFQCIKEISTVNTELKAGDRHNEKNIVIMFMFKISNVDCLSRSMQEIKLKKINGITYDRGRKR